MSKLKKQKKKVKHKAVGNNQKIISKKCGDVDVCLKGNVSKTISNVMYIPELATNFLSVSQMTVIYRLLMLAVSR